MLEELEKLNQAEKQLTEQDLLDMYGTLNKARSSVLAVEECLAENQRLRAEHAGEGVEGAKKFMQSEERLHMMLITQVAPLTALKQVSCVANFVAGGGLELLLSLLEHENEEIAIMCAARMLKEMTDEDNEAGREFQEDLCTKIVKWDSVSLIMKVAETMLKSADEDQVESGIVLLQLVDNIIEI